MAPIDAKTAHLIAQIEQAFCSVERPRITLRVARGMDDNQWDDFARLERLDSHYDDWTAIPEEDTKAYLDVFPWLCPVGFRFYLPAFMVNSLKSSRRLISEPWLLHVFGEISFRESDFAILSESQREAVRDFLIAAFASVPDDYNWDWWNHPWDKDWDEDVEKEDVWQVFGKAFTSLVSNFQPKASFKAS